MSQATNIKWAKWSGNRLIQTAVLAILILSLQPSANALDLNQTVWGDVGAERKIDPNLLLAVALVESRKMSGPGMMSPHTFAIRDKDGSHFCKSAQEAEALLKDRHGNIDVGLMQINLLWNGNRVKEPSDLLDPRTNIRVGADILIQAINSSPTNLILGIGRYHRPGNDSEAMAYGQTVYQTWINLSRLAGRASV